MNGLNKTIQFLTIILLSLILCSCGFHTRRAADVPPQLKIMALKTQQPYSDLVTQIKSMLRSLNITLVKPDSKAPYVLEITSIAFHQSNPPIITTTLAVTLTYSLSINVKLLSRDGKVIIPEKTLDASYSISQNPSQVYTPGTATLAKQELRRDITSKLYYLLTSNNTRNALNHVH